MDIIEFFGSLVVTYKGGSVVTYACIRERSEIAFVPNTPVFHDHPGIHPSAQMELFDLSDFQLRYVSRRPPYQKHPPGNATQLIMEILGQTGHKPS